MPPDTVPVNPTPTPTPGTGNVPYYGEWIITYTSDVGTSFVHALQITTDVSTANLRNAGGGLQELCNEAGRDNCGGSNAAGFGVIGDLVLDDGTAPLSLGIFTQYGSEDPVLKLLTIDPIVMQTNAQGQQTFTARSAWVLPNDDIALGSITGTNIGTPRTLNSVNPLAAKPALSVLRQTLKRFR